MRSKGRWRRGGEGGGGCCDCEMMAPLRDGDPLVFMNEPSRVGWSVMALRTNLRTYGKPSCHPFLTTAEAETRVNIKLYTYNDASVTHKARFLWQMPWLILHLDLRFSISPPPPCLMWCLLWLLLQERRAIMTCRRSCESFRPSLCVSICM